MTLLFHEESSVKKFMTKRFYQKDSWVNLHSRKKPIQNHGWQLYISGMCNGNSILYPSSCIDIITLTYGEKLKMQNIFSLLKTK